MYGRRDSSVREAGGCDPQSPPSILTKWMTQRSSPPRKRRHQIQAKESGKGFLCNSVLSLIFIQL